MTKEIWKDIKGYPEYQVSNLGNVKSLNYKHTGQERILTPITNVKGYYFVNLYNNKVMKPFLVHRLVAYAFIPNPNNLPFINHKDETHINNCVDNLEWCDTKYNVNYGTRNLKTGMANGKSVLQIDKEGNIIAQYYSMHEAVRQTEIPYHHIKKCCKGIIESAGGYIWKI